jgi:hypothetical protein
LLSSPPFDPQIVTIIVLYNELTTRGVFESYIMNEENNGLLLGIQYTLPASQPESSCLQDPRNHCIGGRVYIVRSLAIRCTLLSLLRLMNYNLQYSTNFLGPGYWICSQHTHTDDQGQNSHLAVLFFQHGQQFNGPFIGVQLSTCLITNI